MPSANIYLNFKDNCEEAFNYYKSVFGGDFTYIGRYSDMPPQEGQALSETDKNKIMHVSLRIGKESVLMGSDSGGEWASNIVVGNNFSISINADSREQADRFFDQLSSGGKATMPMNKTFWGEYFGMCTDKFGINWMFSVNENPQKKD
jgi:PhnB protein